MIQYHYAKHKSSNPVTQPTLLAIHEVFLQNGLLYTKSLG